MARVFNPVVPLSKGAATHASPQERPLAPGKRGRASAALGFLSPEAASPKAGG